jgi:hypothetical protein
MLVLGVKQDGKVNLYLNGVLLGSVIRLDQRGQYTRLGFEFDHAIKIVREDLDLRLEETPR